MGHKVLKSRLKYAVLNKETKGISIYHLQKDVADLFNVSRKTILRNIKDHKKYENDKYIVYLVVKVP
jgi:phage regulator Rha-like protein